MENVEKRTSVFCVKMQGNFFAFVKMENKERKVGAQMKAVMQKGAQMRRFPRYYRVLRTMISQGIYRCSSEEIAARCGCSPSLVRADLKRFAGCAKQGYGYQLSKLYPAIGEYLGVNDRFRAVLVASGLLRDVLATQPIFSVHGIRLCAVVGQGKADLPYPSLQRTDLAEFCHENQIELLLIAEPFSDSELDACVRAGVKGIWNLSPEELSPRKGIAISQVHPIDSLMELCCALNQSQEQEESAF